MDAKEYMLLGLALVLVISGFIAFQSGGFDRDVITGDFAKEDLPNFEFTLWPATTALIAILLLALGVSLLRHRNKHVVLDKEGREQATEAPKHPFNEKELVEDDADIASLSQKLRDVEEQVKEHSENLKKLR